MKNFLFSLYFLFPIILTIILMLLTPIPSAQLTTTETKVLLQIQTLLEYPQLLHKWKKNLTNFCNLSPSPSFIIVCSKNHVTELTIIGNKTKPVSERFSTDSLFTVLTRLSNMKVLSLVSLGLRGPLPSKITRFKSLEVFNISSNFFYGEIPLSVSSLKNLKSLVFADNFFNGNVPNLKRLAFLEEINLANNRLGPDFPSSLFSLPSLHNLNLASNRLTGSIPANISCNPSLNFLDISHNFLQGKLPWCIDSKSLNRTIVYSGNCLSTRNFSDQHLSSYCKKSSVLNVKPRFERPNESKKQLGLGVLIGIIGGFVGAAVFLILLFLFILRKSNAKNVSVTAYSRPNIYLRRNVPQLMRIASNGLPPYRLFRIKEIEDATDNFDSSNLIGEGSKGQQYKGRLKDGSMVMVNQKSLSKISDQNLKVLPYLRHRHLVSVVGHCSINHEDNPKMKSTLFIVFEHISNMSLRIHLTDRRKSEMLKWQQRMAIIIGIARGIKFLHTGVTPGIFGNNIKIENVLLDNSLNPKVSGYSIPFPNKKGSERKHKQKNAHNHVSSINSAEKEDIYHFGLIQLELITGKLVTSSMEVEVLKYELERGLCESASPNALRSAIDPSLHGTYAHESLKTAVLITINCLSKAPRNRPSIEDVLWNLQYSMQVQEGRSSKAST
ncbi:probable LRR receptor-like serine/threonine-protein kinase At1g14390 [Lathyrus oleraceus]|uniref:non-specific serine/threonine protein kinase n=1 Tax=Pisum sativum TaxID=3888 RepID=A0A9D5BBE8_PEA|nr:probable LRR receptor-like serine/threonine-protein kinase At1g14390 [Pisum sativum]KAI5437570.1 hypothetical protein KIW84_023619 [Pisum sativum]